MSRGVAALPGRLIVAVLLLAATGGLVLLQWKLPTQKREELLIFYANETSRDAVNSENYKLLFNALSASGKPDAQRTVDILSRDAVLFSAVVEQQIKTISNAAVKYGFEAVIFTNEMAQRQRLLHVHPSGRVDYEVAFDALSPTASKLLESSPLSRSDAFQAALSAVTRLPESYGRDLILFTSSHGDEATALMPRVFADLSTIDRDVFVLALQAQSQHRNESTLPVRRVGVSKIDFWRILAEFSSYRFAIVFRETCRSGVSSFAEYTEIQSSVAHLAHSGGRDLRTDEIDYAKLFTGLDRSSTLSLALVERLREQGISVDTRHNLLGKLLLDLFLTGVAAAAPVLCFVPIPAWIVWNSRRRRRGSSA